jgi:cobalt-zinc-cadmium efflux system protein
MRDALRLGLDGVPAAIDHQAVADWLGAQDGVSKVHDFNFWALSTTGTALAVHLIRDGADADAFLDHVTDEPEHDFSIAHATVQLESCACERAGACLAT